MLYLGGSNQDLAIFGGAQVVHDTHELACLCLGLLGLWHMQVHFVAIKVSVVWTADALVEAKRPAATAS